MQPKTWASFDETIRRYIVKEGSGIGALRVRDVEPEDVEAMLKHAVTKSRRGALSANTLRIIRACASLLFKDAIKRLKLDMRNPCKDLDTPLGTLSQADRQRTIRAMTYAQIVRFLRAVKKHCTWRDYTLFHVLADTGLRPSEALALQWADLDTTARTLRVERAVMLHGQIKATKTGRVRIVPLTVPLADALTAWRRRAVRQRQSSDYMFPAKQTGRPLNVKRIGRQFRALLRIAEIGPFKLYDLRHTFASHLLDQGVKPVDVADVMGHKHLTTTLQFYAHAIPSDLGYIDRLTAARQGR